MISNMYIMYSDIVDSVAFTPPYSAIPSYPYHCSLFLKRPFSHSCILGWFCDILSLKPSHFGLHYGSETLKSLSG